MTMKISDEIRKWCDSVDVDGDACGELRDLADLIDSEMVELPKDADGEPIHVGDTAYLKDGREVKVIRFIFEPETPTPTIVCSLDGNPDVVRLPFELWHERHDSLELIADELDEVVDAARSADDSCEKLADLAGRIRRLAKEDDK